MTAKDAIDVLQIIKRKELRNNAKASKLFVDPPESIGAKAIDEAINVLRCWSLSQSAPTVLKWNNINDKWPEPDTNVFIVAENDILIAFRPRSGDDCFCGLDNQRYYNVTHWMPLPELPEIKK